MGKALTFNRFNSNPLKVRFMLTQKALNELGYKCAVTGKRDRETIEALKKLQSDNGLAPNATICSKTFEILNIKSDKI